VPRPPLACLPLASPSGLVKTADSGLMAFSRPDWPQKKIAPLSIVSEDVSRVICHLLLCGERVIAAGLILGRRRLPGTGAPRSFHSVDPVRTNVLLVRPTSGASTRFESVPRTDRSDQKMTPARTRKGTRRLLLLRGPAVPSQLTSSTYNLHNTLGHIPSKECIRAGVLPTIGAHPVPPARAARPPPAAATCLFGTPGRCCSSL